MTELPSGTVTFFLTDLEESTSKWEAHPDAMHPALARHDEILRETVENNGGWVVKSTGDGIHAVFQSATDAVDAAAAAVRTLSAESWDLPDPLRVRIGIHTGSAEMRDGDYFGLALNRTSRLMSAAHGGQVVLSQMTAELVRDQLGDELRLIDLGEHRLRGLVRPERIFEVAISGHSEEFPPLRSLDAMPGALDLPPPTFARDTQLADREEAFEELQHAWKRATDGARQVVLLAGEAGIGKTRLIGELAQQVYDERGTVLYGRGDEDAIVACQPFVEALRPAIAGYAMSTLTQRLHGLEQDLAPAFPELSGRIPTRGVTAANDPEAERYRFFEAVTLLLTGITASRPTLLVLDDLHWADRPSMLLLRHLIRSAPRAPLLITACYREVEARDRDVVANLLGELRREPFTTQLSLGGLPPGATGELLHVVAGHEVPRAVIDALHEGTAGNPFFLEELARHLTETNALPTDEHASTAIDLGTLQIPDGVREVIAQRLRRLPSRVNEVLQVAAIVGLTFDSELIGRAAAQPTNIVLEVLDIATEAGLVHELPDGIGRYAFSHALIRETLTRDLGRARRAQLHARVGDVMDRTPGVPHPAAELALHFTQAVPLIGTAKAIDYSAKAGHDAVTDLAFDEAVSHFETAIELLEQSAGSASTRVDLLTDLASALVYVDEQAGVEAAMRAVDVARRDGTKSQFARAVIVCVEPTYGVMTFPNEIKSLCDEALEVLGDTDPVLRARLLAYQAFKYASYTLHGRDGRVLAEQAVTLARQTDDAPTLADALFTHALSMEGTAGASARIRLGEELIRLGRRTGARETAFGLRVLAGSQLELGAADALSRTINELAHVGVEQRWLPAQVYAAQWRVTQAMMEGRFDDARTWLEELRRSARAYRGAAAYHLVQAFQLAREQGERRAAIAAGQIVDDDVQNLYPWAVLTLSQLEAGDVETAGRNLAVLAGRDPAELPPESGSGSALAMLTEIAATLGATTHAQSLYDRLEPFAGELLSVVMGLACLGSADRYLAMLCTLLERWDEADHRYEQAIAQETHAHGHALLPRTRYWQASSKIARKRAGDSNAAQMLLDEVIEDTVRLGMQQLYTQARDLRASI